MPNPERVIHPDNGAMVRVYQAAGDPETAALLAEVGGALLVLGLIAFLANRLKFSVVPFYLVLGLAMGEGALIPVSLSEDFLNTGAQIGAIMLLLLLGLEYSSYDLAKAFTERKSVGLLMFSPTRHLVLFWDCSWVGVWRGLWPLQVSPTFPRRVLLRS